MGFTLEALSDEVFNQLKKAVGMDQKVIQKNYPGFTFKINFNDDTHTATFDYDLGLPSILFPQGGEVAKLGGEEIFVNPFSVFKSEDQEFFETCGFRIRRDGKNIIREEREILEEAERFFASVPLSGKEMKAVGIDAVDVPNYLLNFNQGISIGELHIEHAPRVIVKKLLRDFYERGGRYLFMESFRTVMQGDLDSYTSGDQHSAYLLSAVQNSVKRNLQKIMDRSGITIPDLPGYELLDTVSDAQNNGIKVVGLGSDVAWGRGSKPGTSPEATKQFLHNRSLVFNYTGAQTIKLHLAQNPEAKYLILTGQGHACGTLIPGKIIPGFAEILGCPSVLISQQRGNMQVGVQDRQEIEKLYSKGGNYGIGSKLWPDFHLIMNLEKLLGKVGHTRS